MHLSLGRRQGGAGVACTDGIAWQPCRSWLWPTATCYTAGGTEAAVPPDRGRGHPWSWAPWARSAVLVSVAAIHTALSPGSGLGFRQAPLVPSAVWQLNRLFVQTSLSPPLLFPLPCKWCISQCEVLCWVPGIGRLTDWLIAKCRDICRCIYSCLQTAQA